MQYKKHLLMCAAIICCVPFFSKAQDLLHLADSIQSAHAAPPPLESTWKDTRLINAQTTKTVAPGAMVFRVMHRFGSMGVESNGGVHTLYGFDVVTDIYLGFEFGILKNLEAGFGRSKGRELIDVNFKYRPLTQKSVGMPISLAIYGDAAVTPELNSTFYNGSTDTSASQYSTMDKFSYDAELLIDRKFGRVASLELIAGFNHRNYVLALTNPNNHSRDSNNILYFGGAAKICLSKHAAIVGEYYYVISPYRTNNTNVPYYNNFSIGYEIETGGHVFEINLSNSPFMNVNNFIPSSPDSWAKGGLKLGFSISRLFNL
jgi:hypothetical protein